MKPASLTLYRLTIAVLLAALIFLANENRDLSRQRTHLRGENIARQGIESSMRHAYEEKQREVADLRTENADLKNRLEGILRAGKKREGVIREGLIVPGTRRPAP